jgi:hypothetical protein
VQPLAALEECSVRFPLPDAGALQRCGQVDAAAALTGLQHRGHQQPVTQHKLVVDPAHHGLINYIDAKAKRRHPKKLTYKRTQQQVFIRVCRLVIQSVMLVFSTQLCVLLPPNLLSDSTPPTPLPCVKVQFIFTDSVWLGGGGGVESCWRPYSAGV